MGSFLSLFASPAMLALAAVIPPAIVVMYLLKLKRRPQVVPSTLLWRRSVQDLVANAPFQKLRNNILLWLQLLAAALLILGLSRPILKMGSGGGEKIILLLDLSASMQAREADGKTRFEKAQKVALDAIDGMATAGYFGLNQADEMMILGFADRTMPLQALTSDRGALRRAVESARTFDTPTNMEDAGYILREQTTRLTERGPEPLPNTRVVLISDGAIGPSVGALSEVGNLEFVKVGESADNVGISGIDVREAFTGDFEYQVFANITNAAAEPKSVLAEFEVGGAVLDVKKVDLPAAGSAAVVFATGEAVAGVATIRLADNDDALALDDAARAVVSPTSDLRVLLVSRGNSWLKKVLTVDPRTDLTEVRAADYSPAKDFDIVVFDDCTVPELPPTGNFLFVNALPPADAGFTQKEKLERPAIIDWNRVHPLTRYANFERVLIGEAMSVMPPPGGVSIVQAAKGDLISLHESDTRRFIVIAFDITKSYWPLDVSFPIFFANVLDYWSRIGATSAKPGYTTGQTIPIVPPRDAKQAEVALPDGRKLTYPLEGQKTVYLTETVRAGLYTATFDGGGARSLAVNLASHAESSIAPADAVEVGGKQVKAATGEVKARQEIWHWLALAGLAILMIEWAIYTRRTFM